MLRLLHIGTLGKPHGIKGAISIYAKTIPSELIFELDLYLHDETPFKVSSYEVHHKKVILFSDSISDRTASEQWNQTKLYCQEDEFRKNHPDQVFYDLCQGYRVIDQNGKEVGILEEVFMVKDIPLLMVQDQNQTIHLGFKDTDFNHDNKTIILNYDY